MHIGNIKLPDIPEKYPLLLLWKCPFESSGHSGGKRHMHPELKHPPRAQTTIFRITYGFLETHDYFAWRCKEIPIKISIKLASKHAHKQDLIAVWNTSMFHASEALHFSKDAWFTVMHESLSRYVAYQYYKLLQSYETCISKMCLAVAEKQWYRYFTVEMPIWQAQVIQDTSHAPRIETPPPPPEGTDHDWFEFKMDS